MHDRQPVSLHVEALEARAVPALAFTTIDVPGATQTDVNGVNDAGAIVGSYIAGGVTHGFTTSGGSYTTLDVPGSTSTAAWDINDAGQVTGSYVAGGLTHTFLLSGDTYTTIDVPGAIFTMPRGINDAGEVVGAFKDSDSKLHGFLYSAGAFTTIDVPGASFTSYASGINDQGDIVGRYDTASSNYGFLLKDGTYTTLDVPDSASSAALGITNSGVIVGGYTSGGSRHGYLLSDGAYTEFDVPGSTLTTPEKINDFGLIAGFYIAGGTRHGFLATTEPPASVESVIVNDGSAQRSMVDSLTVTFDHLVSVTPGALTLEREGGGLIDIDFSTFATGGKTVAVITFTGPDAVGGSLTDGRYALVVHADKVHDFVGRELDGDGDGSAGGDRLDGFVRLFGDTDGDADVDARDLLRLLSTLGKHKGDSNYLWYLDYDASGSVGILDVIQFANRLHL